MKKNRQLEPFTPIPNDLLEKLISINISGTQKDVVFAICRLTFGWQEEEREISAGDIGRYTRHKRTYVVKKLKELSSMNIIKKTKQGYYKRNIISINLYLDTWKIPCSRKRSSTQLHTNVSENTTYSGQSGISDSSQLDTHKRNKEIKEREKKYFEMRNELAIKFGKKVIPLDK